jgi:transaldolase
VTRLHDLYAGADQSPWIDNIRRDWLEDGTLARLVDQGVRGVTSNPSIFAKALATSQAYDALIAATPERDPERLFETLAVADVQAACDVLTGVHHEASRARRAGERRHDDGFVSLEVSPHLAFDTAATVEAARRLHQWVDRANLLVKIPATREGLPAITESLAAGVSVNVTLIFSVERYGKVLDAWLAGLEGAVASGRDLASIASVASFFVSRVDSAVDALLPEGDPRRGTAANAQAAAAYDLFLERVASARATALLAHGAQIQRPLWASTSTKNPDYPDLLYVDGLVGAETVNTMPDATLAAALDHLRLDQSWLAEERRGAAAEALAAVERDVDLAEVTARLEREGVTAFVDSYEELLATVAAKAA